MPNLIRSLLDPLMPKRISCTTRASPLGEQQPSWRALQNDVTLTMIQIEQWTFHTGFLGTPSSRQAVRLFQVLALLLVTQPLALQHPARAGIPGVLIFQQRHHLQRASQTQS